MKVAMKLALVFVASAFVAGGLAGCGEKSNEEKAKDAVDKAAGDAKGAIDKAAGK